MRRVSSREGEGKRRCKRGRGVDGRETVPITAIRARGSGGDSRGCECVEHDHEIGATAAPLPLESKCRITDTASDLVVIPPASRLEMRSVGPTVAPFLARRRKAARSPPAPFLQRSAILLQRAPRKIASATRPGVALLHFDGLGDRWSASATLGQGVGPAPGSRSARPRAPPCRVAPFLRFPPESNC